MIGLLLATRNSHKVQEIQLLLPPECQVWSLAEFPEAPCVVEDAATFAGNATKKAVQLARWIASTPAALDKIRAPGGTEPLYVLADDSGLEVDALHGLPGVNSARFAAVELNQSGNSPDAANNAKLLRLLNHRPFEKRTARFRCVIALTPIVIASPELTSPVCFTDESELATELFDGTCEGSIGFAPIGQAGFGYDPLFVPRGFNQTFAELGEQAKNQISHRSRALAQLRRRFDSLGS